jgi:Acetyltransferase (GNAT) domain
MVSQAVFKLIAERRSFPSFHRDEWDDFAAETGESFLGTWNVISARRLSGEVRLFDFILVDGIGTRKKIGQCAVHISRGTATFLDKIQLLPEQRHLNRESFDLVRDPLGDMTFKYGSRWNDEDEFNLEDLSQFDVEASTFHVDLIDLRDWPNYAAYRRSVSENIRRDYKKAKEAGAVLRTAYGYDALRDIGALVSMRRHMLRRHHLSLSRIVDFFSHIGRLFVLGKNAFVTTVRVKGKVYAAFFGVEVGDRLYYISGGTRANHLGAGSFLFLTLIENWFTKHPNGEFLMGDCPEPYYRPEHDVGIVLYRMKLRVKSLNGVEFRLKPRRKGAAASSKSNVTSIDQRKREGPSEISVPPVPEEIAPVFPREQAEKLRREARKPK